ncbi:nesprin-2-like isoform X2 [Alosa sapidissima]|uniref:nesprin-2-like isoform X2 n=1 Tax=Alosa sapidissima TaxID=34773 RepID=UPI001C08A54D|nr:nesprin-2-like isoform X2 [Alosa sapidissima]
MASGRNPEDDSPMEEGTIPLDIDDVHMLLQVEQEQIQKRTFTNWMNAQLSKRTPPTVVQDLFTDLQDGMRLLDLLEVMSGQRMKRERGHGVFQHRGNIETALKFLKTKSVKLVNINIPDLIEGRPSIVLGLIWTIILHCHIEELASTLSFGSRHSSLESLASLDSLPGSACSSPVPGGSPVPRGRSSPLHARFRLSAKKALLLWVRDQCHKVGCSISVKDFKSSWRSGVAFLAILCALRPDLVDLPRAQSRGALQNLEEAFRLAEQELHIPRLLEPEDIDVSDPDEKSIMTYVAQFLQYSNDMPSPDDDIQASPSQKAREMACWLQRAYEELEEVWSSTEGAGYAERYQAFQAFVSTFYEQRRPVIPLLSAMKRSPKPSREQIALRQAWSTLEQKLQQYNTELDVCLPAPLDTLGLWLQRVEAVLAEEGGVAKDHAHAAREAREKQEQLKVLVKDMGLHLNTLHIFSNTSPNEATWVPPDKLDELKRRFTSARVTAKYYGIKLEYREQRHTVSELLGQLNGRLKAWRGPYSSQDAVRSLLQDWHEIVDKQCLVSLLKAAIHKLKQTASTYTSKAALADDAQMVSRQVREVEAEASTNAEGVIAARGTMGRVLAAWESYRDCLFAMQVWLGQQTEATDTTVKEDSLREWISRHAHLNEVGNFLIESTDGPTSFALANELCKVNKQWADFVKRTRFAVSPTASSVPACAQAAQALVEEAGWMAREPVEVSSGSLRTYRKRLQVMVKKITEVDLDTLATSSDCSAETLENLKETLPKLRESLGQVQQACEGVQRGASLLEGRLAELVHWSTEVSEALDTLREWERRGHPGLRPRVKTLVSRGLQLEAQLATEERELQASLTSAQQSSSLPYLSISTLQDRVKEASTQTKELVGMLSHLDVKREGGAAKGQPPPKVIIRAQSQPDLPHGPFDKHTPKTQLLQAQSQPDLPHGTLAIHSPKTQRLQAQSQPDLQHGTLAKHSPKIQHLQAQSLPEITVEEEIREVQAPTRSRVQSQLTTGGPGHKGPERVSADARSKKQSQNIVAVVSDPQHQPSSSAGRGTSPPQEPPASSQPLTPPQTPGSQTGVRTPRTRQRPKGGSGPGPGKAVGPPKPPSQNEVYLKARSLAQSRLDGAQHRLQQQVQKAIAVFSNKTLSDEQAKKKEDTMKILKPALLEEFLGSVEGMGRFCSEVQLREMELLALSVRGQWEGVCLAIASFLPHLRCELERGLSARPAVPRHVPHTKSQGSSSPGLLQPVCSEQACVGAADSEGRVRTLRGLKDTLSPPEPLVRATTCVTETAGRLEVAQHHDGQSRETAPPSAGGEATGDSTPLREAGQPADLTPNPAHSQGGAGAGRSMETLQVLRGSSEPASATKQDEGSAAAAQEMQMRYGAAHSAFHLQLQRNSQRLCAEVPQGSATLQVLHTHLQGLQAMRQETEALWFEYELQFSQCEPQLEEVEEEGGLRRERAQLIQRWRAQQICLQARVKTLQTAVTLMEPADIQIALVINRLNYITQNPLNITEFTLADSGAIHEELKLLDDNIQTELDRLAGFQRCDSAPVDPSTDPSTEAALLPVHSAIQQAVQNCRSRLDQQRKRLRRADSALAELERFLGPLQQAGSDLSGLLVSDASGAWEDSSRLTPIQRRAQEAASEAPRVDSLLEDAGLRITLDGAAGGAPGSCREVAGALGRRVEEAHARVSSQLLRGHKKGGGGGAAGGGGGKQKKEQQRDGEKEDKDKEKEKEGERSLSQRRRTLVATLREVKGGAETMGLKEPTLPALQQRLRTLTDMESRLAALWTELQSLQEASAKMTNRKTDPKELGTLWEQTQLLVKERREQCQCVMELLKRFQGCRSRLCLVLQQAEQTIGEQASYMGKDNLHRLLHRVTATKAELGGLGDGVEEIRGVCRQLQHQLRGIPDCVDTPFENEADAIMDRWLDVMERTDCYLDNLRVSLALWDKLLLLGGEVEGWMTRKMTSFVQQAQPFQSECEVLSMQEEIKSQEENVEHFHRRSCEIQHLLQSQEAPLELQVMESQLRNRMEQVRELFAESTDVFKELLAAKGQVSAKMATCQTALQSIQDNLRSLESTQGQPLLKKLQELSGELDMQAGQVGALQRELGLMSSVASQQTLQALTADATQLHKSVCTAKELLKQTKEQAENTHRLAEGQRELQECLKSTEHWALESQEDRDGLQVEMTRQSACVEAFRALITSVQGGGAENASLLENCWKLLERHDHLQARLQSTPHGSLLQEEKSIPQGSLLQARLQSTPQGSLLQEEKEKSIPQGSLLQEEKSIPQGSLLQEEKEKSIPQESLLQEEKSIPQGSLLQEEKEKSTPQGSLLQETELQTLAEETEAQLQSSPQSTSQELLLQEETELQTLAEETQAWVRETQQRLKTVGTGTQRSLAQTQERLQQAKAVLSLRQEGDSRLEELRTRAEKLSQREGLLDGGQRRDVQHLVQDTEAQWVTLQQDAKQLSRLLQGVVERASSCQDQRKQACLRLDDLRGQAAALPRLFPWPGVAERQQAAERSRALLERTKMLGPALSALRAQRKELVRLTQDPSWTEPSWAVLEDGVPDLIRELNELCGMLESSIQKEQRCHDSLQQCGEGLSSLQQRIQRSGLQTTGAQSSREDAKALAVLHQAIERVDRDIKEATALSSSLTKSLSKHGQSALTAQLQSLQDSRAVLEKMTQDRLAERERQKQEEAKRLMQETSSLQRALQGLNAALEQELKAGEQHDGVDQLQKHWVNLKALKSQEEDLILHLQKLQGSERAESPLSEEVVSALGTLTKQSVSLSISLSESLRVCKERTVLSVRESIQALRLWSQSQSQQRPQTAQSTEMALQEGETLRRNLQGALLHTDFLKSIVGQQLMQSLEREGTDALTDSTTQLAGLSQSLQLAKSPVEATRATSAQETVAQSGAEERASQTLSTETPSSPSVEPASGQRSPEVQSTPAKTVDSDAQHAKSNSEVGAQVMATQSTARESMSQTLCTKTPSELSVELTLGQESTGVSSPPAKTLDSDAQKTPSKLPVQLTRRQESTGVNSIAASNAQQADGSFEPGTTLRSSHISNTTVKADDHREEPDGPPKPVLTIVLDADLTGARDSQPATDISISRPLQDMSSHSDAVTTQQSEGMNVPETSLKHQKAKTKHPLELTAREHPELNQEEVLPSPKKVATIILDAELSQNENISTDTAATQLSEPKQSDYTSFHDECSPDELQSTKQEPSTASPSQESGEGKKAMQNYEGSLVEHTKPKKVFTIILEADVSTNESMDSQIREPIEKRSSEVSSLPSENSSGHQQKQPEISGSPENVGTSVADGDGYGSPESVLSEREAELDLSKLKSQDVLLQPVVSSASLLDTTRSSTPTDPVLRVAQIVLESKEIDPIHITQTDGLTQKDLQGANSSGQSQSIDISLIVTRNKHQGQDVNSVTSESADAEGETGTRRPEASDQGVSEEANVVSVSPSHGPDAVSISHVKDKVDTQTRGTELLQSDPSHQDDPDPQEPIHTQSLKKISPMTSKAEMHSLEDDNTDLPKIVPDPQDQVKITKDRRVQRTAKDLVAGDRALGVTVELPQGLEDGDTLLVILGDAEPVVGAHSLVGGEPMEAISCLQPTVAEPATRLGRAVHRVLGCRYQPAQLNPLVMALQLQEAESCRQRVLQQVAAVSHQEADRDLQSEATQRMEGSWSAALLNASATVQVKEAQLLQVKQYHQQTEALRATLQRFTAEMEMLNLDNLGSTSIQAEKLQTFLKGMDQEKDKIGELLQTCCQVSAHLSEADGPVALLAQVEGLQEGWQILQGTADRTLRHATACTIETSAVLQEARELECKLENIHTSMDSLQSSTPLSDCQMAVQLTVTASELTTANEQYINLLGIFEAFNQNFLGKKEQHEMEEVLLHLKAQLDHTQEQLLSNVTSVSDSSVAKLIEVVQNFLPWAKHVEQQVEARRKVALFSEHAHHQLTNIKRLQSEVSARQSQVTSVVEEQKALLLGLREDDVSVMLSLLEDLEDTYQVISEKITHAIEEVNQAQQSREKMWAQISEVSTWLVAHIEKEGSRTRDSKLKASVADLKVGLQWHSATLKEAEKQTAVIEGLLEQCSIIIPDLSIGESHYLIDRLTILQAEVSGVASSERAACWELEELLHAQETTAEELTTIQKSIKQISMDLERQRFPVTSASLSAVEPLRHMLVEYQCHVQELQHCQESQKKGLLQTIHTLQAKARMLDIQAREHEKYLNYRKRMEDSREVVKKGIPQTSDRTVDRRERLQVCRALLMELPLVKQQCQQAADQLEAISGDVYPSQLTSERQKIHRTLESLASWELTIHNELCSIEHKLLDGLTCPADLTAIANVFHKARQELQRAACLDPNEQAIVRELQKCSVLQRSMESGLRVLEALEHRGGTEEEALRELSHYGKKISRDCNIRMDNLSQAWEALKDYQWSVQRAVRFLDDAEPRLLLDLTGTRDCQEELKATQQTVASLKDSFKAHMDRLGNLVPKQTCFSTVETQKLHIQVLSLLLVREAMLEAQGQLRTETLKKYIEEQSNHRKKHVELHELFQNFETRLNECLLQKATSFEECVEQQDKAKVLQEEVWCLAGRLEQLRGVCPSLPLDCGVRAELGLPLLWRQWALLKRRVGVLRARSVQRDQEWKDASLSMERCSLALEGLSRELPDPAAVSGSLDELRALLALTELQQEWLDREQQALASSQALIGRLLGPRAFRDPHKPVQICQELQNLQSHCRGLREKCMLVRRTALTEIQERGRDLEEIDAVRQRVASLVPLPKAHHDAPHAQEAKLELGSQRAKLEVIIEGVKKRYQEVPQGLQAPLQEVSRSLQEVEDKLAAAAASQQSGPQHRLSDQAREVTAGLGKVQDLLQQSRTSVAGAEGTLKCVWDELDRWHSRLAVLEAEVQEVAMEQPDQAHTLMDDLTDPLQLYQTISKQAEQRTAFLSRIPACLQEYEDLLNSATHWQEEAKSWLNTPRTYNSAKCLHGHAVSLQMVLEDSERIRAALDAFLPVMQEISPVCDTDAMQVRLNKAIHKVTHMQQSIMEPHAQLLHVAEEVDAIEKEVKTMEKNVTKINTILSSMDTENASGNEQLQYCQVILENICSMRRTVSEIEHCRLGLGLPRGAEDTLVVFQRAQTLQQPLQELEQHTKEQSARLEEALGLSMDFSHHLSGLDAAMSSHQALPSLGALGSMGTSFYGPSDDGEDEDEEDDEGSIHSSSSGTLTGSVAEDPDQDQTFGDDQGFEFDTTSPTVVMATESPPRGSPSVSKETASVTMASEDIVEEIGSLASKALWTPAKILERTGGDLKSTEHISKANGEASTETGRVYKEPDLTSPTEPKPVLKDLESIPKDTQSVCKEPGSLTMESKSATVELPSIISKAEVITKEQASTTKEFTSVINQPARVLSLPSGQPRPAHTSVTDPQMESAVVGDELQGSPTESESTMLSTVLHDQNLSASPVVTESIAKPPESLLSTPDKTQGPAEDSRLHSLKEPMELSVEAAITVPIQEKTPARPQTAVDSVPAQPEEGAIAKGNLAILLGSLSGKPELESPAFILQEAVAKHTDPSTVTAGHPSLRCASGRELTSLICRAEATGSDVELQARAEALLKGVSTLLQLGSQRLQHSQDTKLCSRSQLHPLLSRHKKFFQDVGRHWAVLQYVSQRLPLGALQSLAELEEQVDTLQKQAVDQGSLMRRNLQEWSQWEEASGRLARLLDELEAGMPSGTPQQEPEGQLQERAAAHQHLRQLLEESRPEFGLVLDQCRALEDRGCSPLGTKTTVPGSGLELRWASVHRRLMMEETLSDQIREQWERFQRDSQSLQEWLAEAKDQLQAWGCHPESEPRDLSWTQLTLLMGLGQQTEVRRAQWSSTCDAGTQLLQLMDSDAPCLRKRLAQLKQSWADVTSTLPTLHSWTKQILCALPAHELLLDLSAWLGDVEKRLDEEEAEMLQEVTDALGHASQLKHCQDLKAEISGHQPSMDHLSQLVEEAGHVKDEADREERTLLAEQVGALHLRCVLLQAKADNQVRQVEDRLHVCSQREGRLHRLHSWLSAQRKMLSGYERPDSCFHIEKALQELQDIEEKLSLKSVELLELKAVRLSEDKEHPSDRTFSVLVDDVTQDHSLLTQQVATLRPSLWQVRDQWVGFERELAEGALVSARTQYGLEQQQRTPCLSLQESSDHVDQMQALQQQAEEGADLWSSVDAALVSLRERVSSDAGRLLTERVERERARWMSVVEVAREEHRQSRALLQLWQEYVRLTGICSGQLTQLWEQCRGPPAATAGAPEDTEGDPTEHIQASLEFLSDIQLGMEGLQTSVGQVLEAAKLLIGQIEPQGAALIQSETRLLSRDIVHLGQALILRREQLQEDLEQYQNFSGLLDSLELHLRGFESGLLRPNSSLDNLKRGLLELSGLAPDLGTLNELSIGLRLIDTAEGRLRTLNDQWLQVFIQATDRYREMHTTQLSSQSFKQRCEDWFALLEKMEADLATDICSTQPAIREQLTRHQKLKVEMFVGQLLLQSVVREALQLLESGPSKDNNLVVRLTERQERWQEALRLAQTRGTLLQGMMGNWRTLSGGQRRLWKLLSDLETLLPPAGLAACSLQQLRGVIRDFQWAQKELQDHAALYTRVLKASRELVPRLDGQAQTHVQEDLDALRKSWEDTQRLLGVRKALAESVILTWKRCETGLADSTHKLEEIKASLEQPLPENLEELCKEENLSKAHQEALEVWGGRLRELDTMKADASQYVLASDTALLQGQLDQLNGHWEELCLKVSLRKQEIADRLHAWVVFNDKNKELCEWLVQMQSKVAHSGEHLSIEEMVDKLKKDCMEEINLFSENKSHLKQLGEQLLSASDKTKEAEVHGAIRDVNARWQSLFDHIETRVKKLKETLVTVHQLDKNMNNLRTWLSGVENQLSQPVLYSACHSQEIHRRLAEQQELQRDIEQHKDSVASVLVLCDALLRDEDACESSGGGGGGGGGGVCVEGDSIQQTTRSLDQRWRNICSLSLERRLRIEETWRLWSKFEEDHSRFQEWLKGAEHVAANPNSSDVLYTDAKEELKNFEGFHREVHERLTQLEVINHQYRQLARENRTDSSSQLKAMVRLVNQRWDALQRRTAAILRRLRYFTSQREEFEGTREGLLVWLTELDLQLTNVEHFSESDIHEKLRRLNGFQKEITLNTNRIDELIVFGEALIQRSCPSDAAHIEDELVELHTYCQEVFRRAARFHQRLTSPHPELKEEPELQQASPGTVPRQGASSVGEQQPLAPAPACLVAPLLERSGRETPVSVDSIPLEWDHTGDVGGTSSHEDDEEGTYYSTLSDVDVTESADAFVKATAHSLGETSGPGRSLAKAQSWHSQDSQLDLTDSAGHTPIQTSTPYKQGYVRLMSECSGSIKSVKRVSLILDDEEQQEEQGLTGLATADKQSGVIERWELLQAQAMTQELSSQRDRQQLTSDLSDITSWLGQVTPELQQLQKPEPDATIEAMEAKVRQLKEMQKTFARYKAMMLSLNLGGQQLQQQGEGGAERPECLEDPGQLHEALRSMNQGWTEACSRLEAWESSLRTTLMRCQEFHETLHALLLWLAHADSRRYTVDIRDESTSLTALRDHMATLKGLEEELRERQRQVGSLQELTAQLLPEASAEDSIEAREKLHVIGNKLRLLLRQVGQDLCTVQKRLDSAESLHQSRQLARIPGSKDSPSEAGGRRSPTGSRAEKREPSPQRSFFQRVLRAAFPLHLLFLLLLVLACLVPLSEDDYSCTLANNFARSFYPMLRYTNGPPPT